MLVSAPHGVTYITPHGLQREVAPGEGAGEPGVSRRKEEEAPSGPPGDQPEAPGLEVEVEVELPSAAYQRVLREAVDTMRDKSSVEIRVAIYKWIGAAIAELDRIAENEPSNANVQDAVDLAMKAIAYLEAYLRTMEERARSYRRGNTVAGGGQQRSSSSYRRGYGRSRRW